VPPFVRFIATLLIGFPGGLIWLLGMITTLLSTYAIAMEAELTIHGIVVLALSVPASLMGFSMVVAVEIFNGARRYRMPRGRLPAYLGFEFLFYQLVVAAAALVFPALAMIIAQRPVSGLLILGGGVAAAIAAGRVERTRKRLGQRWRSEPVDLPPPAEPSP
jgi:hypothetical protein